MKAPILAVADLSIRRDRFTILDNISWTIQPGEHWVLLGPNGCGKTSLLSALTGYLNPTSGEIQVLGDTYGQSDWHEMRKSIGLVSSSIRQWIANEEVALDTVVSGKYAMIDYWGKITPEETKEARRLLRMVEAEALENRPWLHLSQGERQRVLIARALMAHPKLLILDEPCSGLDPVAREHFLQFVNRLATRRKAPSIVLVTHHVEEITSIFTHALLLSHGKIMARGPVKSTLTSANLSAAFECDVVLRCRRGQYQLEFPDAE